MKSSEILNINQILSDRSRLAIMAYCAANDKVDFNTLLEATEMSKGNLSSHVRRLEEAGYIEVVKEFVDRKPKTTYSCTKEGKKELKIYLERIEKVLKNLF